MARLNVKAPSSRTHEGAKAKTISAEGQLRRSLMSCLLWEKEFYEDGKDVAARIADLVPRVEPRRAAEMAEEARNRMLLRHAPLLVAREMARHPEHKALVSGVLRNIIQRPDELTEFLAIYWKDGRQPLSAQVKKGLAAAFGKFDEYQLAKYNRKGAVTLRDVLFLSHARAETPEQDALWKRLIAGELAAPDTWEVSLSAKSGLSRKEKWERLLRENRLGALALLRNLRNLHEEQVDAALVEDALAKIRVHKILPFRFVAAARHVPQWEAWIESAMMKSLEGRATLPGRTAVLVDVSGSMDARLSARSDMKRVDAGCGLAILACEIFQDVVFFSFSDQLMPVPKRRGFALRDAILASQPMQGTYLGKAVRDVYLMERGLSRLIVITDEQSHDPVPDPGSRGYLINIGSSQNGVGYGPWIHIDGWSEAVLDYIVKMEDDGGR